MIQNVILDCDPGIDDALAMLLAFASDSIRVQAITLVGGNQDLRETLTNALQLMSFAGLRCEVAAGAQGPLMRKLVTAPEVHGEHGLGGQKLPPAAFTPSSSTALEVMHRLLNENTDKTVLIATGPLTNLAVLFLAYPADKERISYISLMGGACSGGNQSPATEFNIYVDPEAAKIVFDSGVPIVMHGLDVTTKAFLTRDEIDRIRGLGTKTAVLTADLLDYYMIFHKQIGLDVVNMHDLCAVAYVTAPELFSGQECHVDIETRGDITCGCTVADFKGMTGKPENVKAMLGIDRQRFVEMFLNALKSYQ